MPPSQQLRLALAGVLLILSSGADGFAVSVRLGRSASSSTSSSGPSRFGSPYSTESGVITLGATAGEASSASSAAAVEAAEKGQTQEEEDLPQALIFDCDGVLADTERDGHRPAFNAAFKIKNLGEGTRISSNRPHVRMHVSKMTSYCPIYISLIYWCIHVLYMYHRMVCIRQIRHSLQLLYCCIIYNGLLLQQEDAGGQVTRTYCTR